MREPDRDLLTLSVKVVTMVRAVDLFYCLDSIPLVCRLRRRRR
jgi:hypothetical protein